MLIPTLYLTIAGEVLGFILIVMVGYILLQRRDKLNLLSYVNQLKEKVSQLKRKLIEKDEMPSPIQVLLEEAIEHVKSSYEQTYGHEIGAPTSTNEDNSKEHFIFILGYQSLKAELSAIENSRTAEKTWEKIASQLGPLVDNFRSQPEVQKVIEKVEIPTESEAESEQLSKPVSTAAKSRSQKNKGSVSVDNDLSTFRKGEIDRLKGQISTQFEEIFNLQLQLSQKVSDRDDTVSNEVNDGFEIITRQLKDAELCITMMDAEIQTANETILDLQEQLESIQSTAPVSGEHNDLAEQLVKKDAFIDRTIQENKEMMTLIEGMEKHSDEQAKQITELEAELEKFRSS